MRAGRKASRHRRLMELTARRIGRGVDHGLIRRELDDERLEGARMTIDGRPVIDFGSASYLALNRDQRLVAAAREGLERYGVAHSSSTAYTALPYYGPLRRGLETMVGAPVAVAASTTLGHLAALPVLVGPDDLVVVDAHAHASMHLASGILRGAGTDLVTVPHNDVAALVEVLEARADEVDAVWFLADGVYSMWGDTAPVEELVGLLDRYPTLHLYLDDAHGFGWAGEAGRGVVLDRVTWHERMVVVAGLSKSFAASGGMIAAADPAYIRQITLCGSTFTFSGPIQTAELAAGVASTEIHLSAEHAELQVELMRRIDLVRDLLVAARLPVVSLERTPLWFLRLGTPDGVEAATWELLEAGYYVNPAAFPAVPVGESGIRFTQTLYNDDEQLAGLIDALARIVPRHAVDTAGVVDLR